MLLDELCLSRGLVGMNNDRKGKFNRYTTWNEIQEQVIHMYGVTTKDTT